MERNRFGFALRYGVPFAGLAVLLHWAEHRYLSLRISGEDHVTLAATIFVIFGISIDVKLSRRPAPAPFEANEEAALASLDEAARIAEIEKSRAVYGDPLFRQPIAFAQIHSAGRSWRWSRLPS